MGITGSYAGQLFGLLIGFGLAMLKKSLKMGKPVPIPVLYPLTSKTLLDMIVLVTTLVVLTATFIYGHTNKFNFGCGEDKKTKEKHRGMAYLVGGIYAIFILIATGLAFKNAYF